MKCRKFGLWAPSTWLSFLKPCNMLTDESFLDDSILSFVIPSEFFLYFEVSSTLQCLILILLLSFAYFFFSVMSQTRNTFLSFFNFFLLSTLNIESKVRIEPIVGTQTSPVWLISLLIYRIIVLVTQNPRIYRFLKKEIGKLST